MAKRHVHTGVQCRSIEFQCMAVQRLRDEVHIARITQNECQQTPQHAPSRQWLTVQPANIQLTATLSATTRRWTQLVVFLCTTAACFSVASIVCDKKKATCFGTAAPGAACGRTLATCPLPFFQFPVLDRMAIIAEVRQTQCHCPT